MTDYRVHAIPLPDGCVALLKCPNSFSAEHFKYISIYLNLLRGNFEEAGRLQDDQQ